MGSRTFICDSHEIFSTAWKLKLFSEEVITEHKELKKRPLLVVQSPRWASGRRTPLNSEFVELFVLSRT